MTTVTAVRETALLVVSVAIVRLRYPDQVLVGV